MPLSLPAPWRLLVLLCVVSVFGAGTSRAQSFQGPAKCTTCHDHSRQTQKWQREEPAAFKGKAHFTTLKQLDGARAAGFARAIGQADPFDAQGACVKCHATVFRGNANAGVSCESCHGPSSAYLELHQEKGSYLKAVDAGMRELRDKPAAIASLCVSCHVTVDPRLSAAGHPSGAAFDAGASLQKLVHWDTRYDYAVVAAAGRSAAAVRLASFAPRAPAAPRAAAAPRSAAAPSAAAAAPWDWDQPVRALPADYTPEVAAKATPAPIRRAPLPAVPPSIAEEAAVPPPLPGVHTPLSVAVEAVPAAAPVPAGSASPLVRVAEIRGRAVRALEQKLRAGGREPELPAPAKPVEFKGPDSELFRLQDEVLALALEALRRPQ